MDGFALGFADKPERRAKRRGGSLAGARRPKRRRLTPTASKRWYLNALARIEKHGGNLRRRRAEAFYRCAASSVSQTVCNRRALSQQQRDARNLDGRYAVLRRAARKRL